MMIHLEKKNVYKVNFLWVCFGNKLLLGLQIIQSYLYMIITISLLMC